MTARRPIAKAGARHMDKVDLDFVESALRRVRSPEARYWLTMGLDAVATAFATMEREYGQQRSAPAARPARAARKRA